MDFTLKQSWNVLFKALLWWFFSGIVLVCASNRLLGLNHTFDFSASPIDFETVALFTCLQETWVVNTLPYIKKGFTLLFLATQTPHRRHVISVSFMESYAVIFQLDKTNKQRILQRPVRCSRSAQFHFFGNGQKNSNLMTDIKKNYTILKSL